MSVRLGLFIERSGVLPATQFAYRKGLCTCDALFLWVAYTAKCIGECQEARIVQIDFREAFDRINHGGMITGGLIRNRVLSMTWSRGTAHKKLKWIDIFGLANWVSSSNFNDTTLRVAEKFDHPFSHVFIFGNMFHESHGFISVPVTRSNNFVSFTN